MFAAAAASPETPEVADAFVRLAEMPAADRPFRTALPLRIEQLLGSYNQAAEAMRPLIAQIFNTPELV